MEDRPHFKFWPRRQPRELALPDTTVWHNLEVSAARYPRKTALNFLGACTTYAELKVQAQALAGWLHGAGVAHGDRVVLYMQNCPQYVVAFYAITRLGAVVVPVNPMNQADEIRHFLADAQARAILCSSDLAQRVESALDGTSMPVVVSHYVDALPKNLDHSLAAPPAAMLKWLLAEPELPAGFVPWREALLCVTEALAERACADDLAILPYTSGTTGLAKGCMHSHRTLMPNIVGIAQWGHCSAESVWLAVAPMFHITGMMGGILSPIFGGGTVVIMPRWDRELAGALISLYRVTDWILIPTMLIDLLGSPDVERFDLSSLRYLNGGGAPMPEAVAERLQERLGLTFVEGYGLTETAAPTHANPVGRVKRQCLGIPFYGVDARVVDLATGEEASVGEVGEIVVAGPTLFLGYWRHPEATREAFLALGGKAFFRTGDLGRVDEEGYFFITDRLKRMINASGFKVWPAEVELTLFKHPAIQEVCVISACDLYRGETVKAVVVLRRDASATQDEIIAWSRGCMAAYKVPRIVEFVDALPKSGSGKVMWRALQEAENARAAAPA